ncbi:MAG TPA: DUF2270 domain-containing protein [Planctomycetes bacterium]|nr:DUF2270 domain-containing protein [Planctomycetota bacterium]
MRLRGAAAMNRDQEDRFESYPLTRSEYIAAMVHLYRGEQYRAQVWRTRLDVTTNWAVLSIGALLSFAFTKIHDGGAMPHVVLVLGMYMIFTMLVFEARRFRFYDAWRNRVRRIEENFYVPILRRDLTSMVENWGFYVAEDLLNPNFKITFLMALKARLVNNYLPLFAVLLGAWAFVFRVIDAELERMDDWVPLAGVAVLYGFLALVLVFVKRGPSPEEVYFGSRSLDSIDDVG